MAARLAFSLPELVLEVADALLLDAHSIADRRRRLTTLCLVDKTFYSIIDTQPSLWRWLDISKLDHCHQFIRRAAGSNIHPVLIFAQGLSKPDASSYLRDFMDLFETRDPPIRPIAIDISFTYSSDAVTFLVHQFIHPPHVFAELSHLNLTIENIRVSFDLDLQAFPNLQRLTVAASDCGPAPRRPSGDGHICPRLTSLCIRNMDSDSTAVSKWIDYLPHFSSLHTLHLLGDVGLHNPPLRVVSSTLREFLIKSHSEDANKLVFDTPMVDTVTISGVVFRAEVVDPDNLRRMVRCTSNASADSGHGALTHFSCLLRSTVGLVCENSP